LVTTPKVVSEVKPYDVSVTEVVAIESSDDTVVGHVVPPDKRK